MKIFVSLGIAASILGFSSACSKLNQNELKNEIGPGYEVQLSHETPMQTWEGWGAGLSWWASVIGHGPFEKIYTDLLFTDGEYSLLNQTLPGLDFNIVRYNIGGGGMPGDTKDQVEKVSSKLDWWKDIKGFQKDWYNNDPNSSSWDWSRDAKQRRILQLAKEKGVNIFEFVAHTPMWWMQDSLSAHGGSLTSWNYENHARHLAQVVKKAIDEWKIPVTSIEPFNEPTAGWWNYPHVQEGSNISADKQSEVLKALRQQLNSAGLSEVKIAASDENTVDEAIATYQYLRSQKTSDLVDKVNVHAYSGLQPYRNNDQRQRLRSLVEANKKIWMTEYGDEDGSGMALAQTIFEDINRLGVSAWFYWQPIEPYTYWGLINGNYSDKSTPPAEMARPYAVHRKYLIMAHFTRFIKAGYRIYPTQDPNTVAAYSKSDRKLVFVTLNWGASQPITYSLSQLAQVKGEAEITTTSCIENTHLFSSSKIKLKDKRLVVEAKANTIYSLVLSDVVF